jgi:predicted anti-sigma-YlaC factor YlaD
MNCREFQQSLPEFMESGGNAAEQEHLQNCPACTDLVADLSYIAEQAKLLLVLEDPPARVWQAIKEKLAAQANAPKGRLLRFRHSGSTPGALIL